MDRPQHPLTFLFQLIRILVSAAAISAGLLFLADICMSGWDNVIQKISDYF